MSTLPIVQIYNDELDFRDSVLFEKAKEIDLKTYPLRILKRIIRDLLETLYSCTTGVGLAANQVGMLIRICVIDVKRDGKNPIILINPSYEGISELEESTEVCLSFPDSIVKTKRFKKIIIRYEDINGKKIEEIVEGFKSIVFQHEIDHLNGICHISSNNFISVDKYYGRVTALVDNILNKMWEKNE